MKTASNSKKDQILATGKLLFWKFGFKRVTIEEICREASVSKMTFYKFFPNKLELAIAILNDMFAENLVKIRKLSAEHESPEKTFNKILQLKAEASKGIGEEFIKDLYTNPEIGLKTYMEGKTQETFTEIINVYEKGKVDGWIRKDLNIPFFFSFIRKSMEHMSSEEYLSFFESPQELIMEVTKLFLYGITPHN